MQETCWEYNGVSPQVHETAFVAPTAALIGNTIVGPHSSIWFHTVLRGDINTIRIGTCTNIQDNATLHVADEWPCIVGNFVTAGHGVILHGCCIEDEVVIGSRAVVLNGAVVRAGTVIGAGSVVTEETELLPDSLVLGIPAKVKRKLTPEERAKNGTGLKNIEG